MVYSEIKGKSLETESPAMSNTIKACLCLSGDGQKRIMMRYLMEKSLYKKL